MKKKYLAYAAVPLMGLTLLAAGTTYAANQAASGDRPHPFAAVATAIATKFNLNSADVQAVIDETMATHHAEMVKYHVNPAARLADAVTAGTITQAQADLIIAKQAELKANMGNLKSLTGEERMTAMKTQMEAMRQWVADNNIPEEFMMFVGRGHRGPDGDRGFGGGPRFGGDTTPSDDTSEVTS